MKKTIFEHVVFWNQWIWEIRAKEQNLFAKQGRRIITSDSYLLRMPIDNNADMDEANLDATSNSVTSNFFPNETLTGCPFFSLTFALVLDFHNISPCHFFIAVRET